MNAQSLQILLLFCSIVVLAYMGLMSQKRVKKAEDMSVGGRSFTRWDIFFSLFAFWGGNTISSIVELSFKDGVMAAWFGLARITMLVLILLITGGAFRKLAMITLSSFVSRCFGSPFLRLVSGVMIALNFTIFTVSSVVGAAAFFTTILGWSVWLSVLFTVFSFLTYTTLGGMHALAYNGKILTVGQILSLLVLAGLGIWQAGWGNVTALEPRFFDFLPAGRLGTVMMWMFTFVINAFVAQAALQIVMSCKDIKEGKKGLSYVLSGFVPVIILSVLAGLAARVLYPGISAVAAMPTLATNMPSMVLSSIVVIGMYFTTLGWASSCILSGGTVAANDIYRYFVPDATSAQLIRASRVAIVLLSLFTVGFAVLLPSGIEFWTIVGFVVRNAGLFPLILIGLFWNAISRRAAIAAALSGSGVGMAWYFIKFPAFLFDAHPMFVGMLVSIAVVTLGTLWEYRGRLTVSASGPGLLFAAVGMAGLALCVVFAPHLAAMKITFACVSYAVCFLFVGVLFLIRRRNADGNLYVFEPDFS